MNHDDKYSAILDLIEDLADGPATAFANAAYERLGLGDPPQQIVDGLAEEMVTFVTTAICESSRAREWTWAWTIDDMVVDVATNYRGSMSHVLLHWPADEGAPEVGDAIPDHVTVVEER